jgi:TonB family protein
LKKGGVRLLNPATGSGEELLRSALNKAELEALEALKLQYFQNATKFLAKGDYDNALAEIKRVLLIDPDHRLAREYESRVTELQASRAQAARAEAVPSPQQAAPRVAPVLVEAPRPAPASRPASRKTWLYVAVAGFLLIGTAGVLTIEKVDDDGQASAATIAATPVQVSAPVEETTAATTVEEPTPSVEVPLADESKQNSVPAEKGMLKSEPVRKDAPPVSSPRASDPPSRPSASASDRPTGSAGIGLLAAVTEKKVEPPPAVAKKETPVPQPEMKPIDSQPPSAEPARETTPFVAVQEEPKIVHLERPVLPEVIARNHVSGSVTAKVMIDRDGKPGEVQILVSSSSVLEQPVIDAIGKSTFTPGMMGNGPVAAWVVIPFKFK